MDYKNITVAGNGVLGSQIAYQTARSSFWRFISPTASGK
jgi:3-hydroxyacyl-CoA dehydrogenase